MNGRLDNCSCRARQQASVHGQHGAEAQRHNVRQEGQEDREDGDKRSNLRKEGTMSDWMQCRS